MLSEICHDIRNYFETSKVFGKFVIQNNNIENLQLQQGQYFRIVGSVFNDGVHVYPPTDLVDEEFTGAVWAMAVPKEVIALASDIEDWVDKYGGIDSANMSPYNSESFGGYSYSKSGGGASADGTGTWQKTFANRLNKYRKI